MNTRALVIRVVPLAVALSASLVVGLAPAAHAMPSPSTAFTSCAGVNAEYPGGVARTQAAADRVVRKGHLRPIVCPTAYAQNQARLDRDRDGVVCERRR
jgi:hypothetical protein